MRKLSAYARKQRRTPTGGQFNGAEWLNTFQRCRGYTDEPIPGAFNADGGQTITAARGAALRVRSAYDAMRTGQIAPDDSEPCDLLAHALGVAWLRGIEIAGPDVEANPMLRCLKPAVGAVKRIKARRTQSGKWGLDGPAISEILTGIEVYEEILMNSTPAQMEAVTLQRERILKEGNMK